MRDRIALVSEPAKRLATYSDLLALPEDARGEIIGGEVVVQPSPTPAHQSTIGEIYAELRNPFQRGRGGPGGLWLIQDVDVEFGPHDVLRPDISGWRRERVPGFPGERPVRHRPDWLCEGLSPRTAVHDQGDKRAIYQRAGVPWYWVVDPFNRTLTVLRLVPDGYVVERVAGDQGKAALPPFEAVSIDLESLFPPAE
jgi:Uma2 family endonuclease